MADVPSRVGLVRSSRAPARTPFRTLPRSDATLTRIEIIRRRSGRTSLEPGGVATHLDELSSDPAVGRLPDPIDELTSRHNGGRVRRIARHPTISLGIRLREL